jgi:hypothetical protein
VTDRPDREERDDHPVAFGLLALVGVAVVVGVIAGVVALAGAKMAGLDGSSGSAEGRQERASLFLPKPERTRADDGPLITLAPGQKSPEAKGSRKPSQESSSAKPKKEISLQAAAPQVSQMDNIDLTGVYPGGEGAILQVQRFENGRWNDFPVTVAVGDGTFATYVQTGQTGVNRFRVVDTDSDRASNEVKVTIR